MKTILFHKELKLNVFRFLKNQNIRCVQFILFVLLLSLQEYVIAVNPTHSFAAGSYIIDMGQATQTVANGLKPYGLVYALNLNQHIPISWSINSEKVKDGVDFTANGKDYKGGSFIISSEYISSTVVTVINAWKAKGVVVDGPSASSFTAPVYGTITSWPRAMLDAANDTKITPYFLNAEIPSSSYVLNADPTMLNICSGPGDVYILPHADPDSWPANQITALKNFINAGGFLFAGCHAVSVLEGISGCNFLSNSLILNTNHSNGAAPFTILSSTVAHPIMQFIGTLAEALQDGSEMIYVPGAAGWRATTTLAIYDPNYINTKPNPDVAYSFPSAAACLVYGRALGNSSLGMVMYEAGHTLNNKGTIAQQVSAQRAFFNFLILAGLEKQVTVTLNVPIISSPGSVYTLNGLGQGGSLPFTYNWSNNNSGVFSNPTLNTTTYTAPENVNNLIITLQVTDVCGRTNFNAYSQVTSLPIELIDFKATVRRK
jgi:hypothetical protein